MTIMPYARKAQYYETDQMGIIHHSNYIRWFEEARVDFMEQLDYGYEKVVETGIDFVLLGLSCEYKNMVKFCDVVEIHCSLSYLGSSKLTIEYRVINKESGLLCAIGHTDHCYYDRNRHRPVSLKKSSPALYQMLELLKTKN